MAPHLLYRTSFPLPSGPRRFVLRLLFPWLFAPAALLASSARPANADLTKANQVFQLGEADVATGLLKSTLSADPKDPGAHQLLCQIYYAEDLIDNAVQECERAVSLDPANSDSQMWLGRAYGVKASHVNVLSAFSMAKRVRDAFERSVALNPKNVTAMSDLGEFYVSAPSIVGGGLDKAEDLAKRMLPLSPAKSHRLSAYIAEKRNDMTAAEQEFKRAIDAGRTLEAYVDLAHFYQRHQRYDEAEATIQTATRDDHTHGPALVDMASVLTAAHRNPQLAQQLLREYLASSTKSEGAPAFRVHVQLGKLMANNGDKAGAKREFQAALDLAANYPPAKRALQGL